MSGVIFYATHIDGQLLLDWINAEPDVAWIVKVKEADRQYTWRAQHQVETLAEQSYQLWHTGSGPLTIPSGSRNRPDAIIANPFSGWEQTLTVDGASTAWFGGNLPGPYSLRFVVSGREHPNSLARSDFSWLANRYSPVGKRAHPEAIRWWNRLKRFVGSQARAVGWPTESSRSKAYVFPDAWRQIEAGRLRDVNP